MSLAQRKGRLGSLYRRVTPGCIVLCYHRVSDGTSDRWRNVVSVENFRDQVRMMRDNVALISVDQLVASLARGKFPERRTIAVTFDDGYGVNLQSASGILVDHSVPAIFYIATEWLDTGEHFWWDELQSIFGDGAHLDTTSLKSLALELNLPWNDVDQQDEFLSLLRTRLKGIDQARRREVLSLVMRHVRGEKITIASDHAPATSEEVISLSREPLFTIGGHTHSHPSLSLLRTEEQRDEIRHNKRTLESIIGKQIRHFSYPFGGREDFDEATIREVRDAGFESAVTMIRTPLRIGCDRFEIPRISVKNWSAVKFKTQLHDLWGQ